MCAEYFERQAMGVGAPVEKRATAPKAPAVAAAATETLLREREAFVRRHIPTLPPASEENVVAMFRDRSARFAAAPRWRAKRDGIWRSMTWSGNQALVNDLIAGLCTLGVRPGTPVGILSETRWEWLAADWAILGLGAVTVPLYASLTPSVIEFMLNDSGAEYIFVENQEQYEKIAQVHAPALRGVIAIERVEPVEAAQVEGAPKTITFDALRSLSGYTPAQADALAESCAAAILPEQVASIIYTSGTTARPKGTVHTHASVMAAVRGIGATLPTFRPGTTHLLWLPLAHVLGRVEHMLGLDRGGITLIAESYKTLAPDIRDAKPNIIVGVPHIYERAYAAITTQAQGSLQRRILKWASATGEAVVEARIHHEPLSPLLRAKYQVADWLVFRKVRAAFGGQLEFSITGGAPIAPELLRFFHAAGILILEGWGLTETMAAGAVNYIYNFRLGSVGLPPERHEIRIGPDGEVLIHGPSVFAGYLNNPEEDAAALDSERWLHTGDLGKVDAEGFVYITGRKKELIVLASGKKVGPAHLETLLKGIPGVSNAFVHGDRKPYLVALLTLNPESVVTWGGRHGMTGTSAEAIAHSSAFARHLDEAVARVNSQLARYETIKRYAVAPEDFTIDNGLLTPSLKIRRKLLYERYHDTIEQLYAVAAPTATATAPSH